MGIVALGTTLVYRSWLPAGEIQLRHSIELEAPDGTRSLRLVPRSGRVKLQDGNHELLASFKLVEGRLRIARAPRELVGFVVPKTGEVKGLLIIHPSDDRVLYRLTRERDGDLRLVDQNGQVVYESKLRDYGFKTVDAEGRVQSRVRVREGKTSLRNAAGETTLSTKDGIPAAAMACFTLRSLSLEHRVALALGIIHWGVDSL